MLNQNQHATRSKCTPSWGGAFLGAIQRPCLKEEVDAYLVLRKLQDQVATWLCHPQMPPRYLALFVGASRLTSPDFPFVDHLNAKSSQQVLDVLSQALRIDAIWEHGIECAKSRLASKGLQVSVSGHKLSLEREVHDVDLKQLLPIEVEAFTFGVTIRDVWVNARAETLGCLHLFPHLEKLSCNFLEGGRLQTFSPSQNAYQLVHSWYVSNRRCWFNIKLESAQF